MLNKSISVALQRNNAFKRCLSTNNWSLHNFSSRPKNHYETLNLSRNCSTKDIKEAFISLSKKYHPDKNKDNPMAHAEFVKINEAYNVLIKPESRRDYDFSLQGFGEPNRTYKSPKKEEYYEVHRWDSPNRNPWNDPSFARNRKFSEENNEDNYYGIKGVKKLSNEQLLFWIIIFAGVGLFIQILIIRYAGMSSKRFRDKVSEENRMYLDFVEKRAEMYGTRERQLEEYRRRVGLILEEEGEAKPK